MSPKNMFLNLATIFSNGDISGVDELFSEDYIDHQQPEWMKEKGADEFKAIVSLARNSLPNLKVTVLEPIVVSDTMVAGRMSWQCDRLERETIEILSIANGKFVEHWGAESWTRNLDDLKQ